MHPLVDWRDDAACGPDTADWFDRRDNALTPANVAALRLCGVCPVRVPCAADILGQPENRRRGVIAGGMVFGVDGGVSAPNVTLDAGRRREQWRRSTAKRRAVSTLVDSDCGHTDHG